MREDGITLHQTHDSKAHAYSWYTKWYSGVKAHISEVEAISDIKYQRHKKMNLFTYPLFCCTIILPVIFVGHRVVKGVPYNSFVVNNAYKQYKCALKCLFV